MRQLLILNLFATLISSSATTNVDVVIHIGQSNQVGTTIDGTALTTPDFDHEILLWELSGSWDFSTTLPLSARTTGGWSDLSNWQGFGPNVGLLRYLYANESAYKKGERKLAGFKFAWNGTSMSYKWMTGSRPTGESLFEQLREHWESAKAELESAGDSVRIIAFDWVGNEADSNYFEPIGPLSVETFIQKMQDFVDDLRTLQGADASTVILWNRVHDGDPTLFDPTRTNKIYGWPKVREGQVLGAHAAPNTFIIDTDGFSRPADNIHYNSDGKELIGVEKAKAYIFSKATPLIHTVFDDGTLSVNFEGVLMESEDMETWSKVLGDPASPYQVETLDERRFFRATNNYGL